MTSNGVEMAHEIASGMSNGKAHIVAKGVQARPDFLTTVAANGDGRSIRRNDFPAHFLFGVATSALQIEGAVSDGGRGPSIWDEFADTPGKISDGSKPIFACDHFNRFNEDILELKEMGVNSYRFSISWPRLFPDGSDKVNPEGVAFYNALIDSVLAAGLIPFVTIYHWDMPQALENDPGVNGWRSKGVIRHYVMFAETCFRYFGDRVKYWTTFNEIHLTSIFGYGNGLMAPGRRSNASIEPYVAAHHKLISHAAAVKIYREKYQEVQKGCIGFAIDMGWFEPYSEKIEDLNAAQRCLEFEVGWVLDPIFTGDYPNSMRVLVGDRLPEFTSEERRNLKGSLDFVGLNYYTASYAKDAPEEKELSKIWWETDKAATTLTKGPDGNAIGEHMGPAFSWVYNCPWGLSKCLMWLENRYDKIPIYITENGSLDSDAHASLEVALEDQDRVQYMRAHLEQLERSIREENVNVKGYFAWTFMDNWEWINGFNVRFGLYYVDFKDKHLKRHPKASAKWYSSFLRAT